ncbi:DUF4860 domain-containing protein [Flavonifractor sp. An100]|uniref:DUF4860 domain-containing protein n=1 Tax=Flavonifractor sp. An100 TaxID=1965538 RepID=UPI000B3B0459|nr:DUF4860 domain-containing protein [Flavonifractor sp. An100]OUQ81651.1 hypothetical protein B5E43_01850 [Flavonifractor sp. An100]
MKQRHWNHSHMESLFALLLFGVFAACVLSVLLTGASAYQRLTTRDQLAYQQRTCTQYLATKVRQAASPDSISVDYFGDGDALIFSQEIDGELYLTRIYCWDGWLRELFTSADGDFSPEDGEQVLPLQQLSLELEDSFLTAVFSLPDQLPLSLTLYIRGEGGELA